MAISPQLLQFKSSGVYRLEFDKSQTSNINVETLRLMVGHSKKGPYNTPVLVENVEDFETIYGTIDSNLENKGMYFHRSVKTALSRGPVLCLNLNQFSSNDKSYYASPGTDGSKGAGQVAVSASGNKNYTDFHDTDKFMSPKDSKVLTAIGGSDDNVFHFVNIKKTPVSIIVRQASDKAGFELTAEEWYGTGNVPAYLNPKDYMGDYMVDVMIFKGKYDAATLATDPVFGAYFNTDGIDKTKLDQFTALRQVSLIGSYTGSVLPGFKDLNGTELYIETMINAEASKTGVFCAIDEDKVIDTDGTKVDLIGHSNTNTSYEVLSHKITPTTVFTYNAYNDNSVFVDNGNSFTLTFDVATPNIDLSQGATQLYLANDSGIFVPITASANGANTVWTITHNSTITAAPTAYYTRTTYTYADGSTYASTGNNVATLTFAVDTPNIPLIAGQWIADSTGIHREVQSVTYNSSTFVHTITMAAGVTLPTAALGADSDGTTLHNYAQVSYNDGGIYAYDSSTSAANFTLTFDCFTPNMEIQAGDFVKDLGGNYIKVISTSNNWNAGTSKHVWTFVTEANSPNHLLSASTPPSHIYRNNTFTYNDGGLYSYTAGDNFFTLTFDRDMVSAANVNLQVGDDILDAAGGEQRITNIALGTYGNPTPGKHIMTVTLANLDASANPLTTGALIVPPFANQINQPHRHASQTWSMDGTYTRLADNQFKIEYDYNTGYDLSVTPNGKYNFPINVGMGVKNLNGDICDVTAVTYSNANGSQTTGPYIWTVTINQVTGQDISSTMPNPFNLYNFTTNTYDDNSVMSTPAAGQFTLTYNHNNATQPLLSSGDYVPDTNGDPIKITAAPTHSYVAPNSIWTYSFDTAGATVPNHNGGEGFLKKYSLTDTAWSSGGTYTAGSAPNWNQFTIQFSDDVPVLGTTTALGAWATGNSGTYFKLPNTGGTNNHALSFGLEFANYNSAGGTAYDNANKKHTVELITPAGIADANKTPVSLTHTYARTESAFDNTDKNLNAATYSNSGAGEGSSNNGDTYTFSLTYTNTQSGVDPIPNNFGWGTYDVDNNATRYGAYGNTLAYSLPKGAPFFVKDTQVGWGTAPTNNAAVGSIAGLERLAYLKEAYLPIKSITTTAGVSTTKKEIAVQRSITGDTFVGGVDGMASGQRDLFSCTIADGTANAAPIDRSSIMGSITGNGDHLNERDEVYALDWHYLGKGSDTLGLWSEATTFTNYHNTLIGSNFSEDIKTNNGTAKVSINHLDIVAPTTPGTPTDLADYGGDAVTLEVGKNFATRCLNRSVNYTANELVYVSGRMYKVTGGAGNSITLTAAPTHEVGSAKVAGGAVEFTYVGRPATGTVTFTGTGATLALDYITQTDHGSGYTHNMEGANSYATGAYAGAITQAVRCVPSVSERSGYFVDDLNQALNWTVGKEWVASNGNVYKCTVASSSAETFTAEPTGTAASGIVPTGGANGAQFGFIGKDLIGLHGVATTSDAIDFSSITGGAAADKSDYKFILDYNAAAMSTAGVEELEHELLGAMMFPGAGINQSDTHAVTNTTTGQDRVARIYDVALLGTTGVVRHNPGCFKITAASSELHVVAPGTTATPAGQIAGLGNHGIGNTTAHDSTSTFKGYFATGWDANATAVPAHAQGAHFLGEFVHLGGHVYECTSAGTSTQDPSGVTIGVEEPVTSSSGACKWTNRGTGTKAPYGVPNGGVETLHYMRFNSVGFINGGDYYLQNMANATVEVTWTEDVIQNHFEEKDAVTGTDKVAHLLDDTGAEVALNKLGLTSRTANNLAGSTNLNPWSEARGYSHRLGKAQESAGTKNPWGNDLPTNSGGASPSIYRRRYELIGKNGLLTGSLYQTPFAGTLNINNTAHAKYVTYQSTVYNNAATIANPAAGQFTLTWNFSHPNISFVASNTAATGGSYLSETSAPTTHAQITSTNYNAGSNMWTVITDSVIDNTIPANAWAIPTAISTWTESDWYDGSFFNSGNGDGTFFISFPTNHASAEWGQAINGADLSASPVVPYTPGKYIIDNDGEYCEIQQIIGGAAQNGNGGITGNVWQFQTDKPTASFTNIGPAVADASACPTGTSKLTEIHSGTQKAFSDGISLFSNPTNSSFKLTFDNDVASLGPLVVGAGVLALGGTNYDHREISQITKTDLATNGAGTGPWEHLFDTVSQGSSNSPMISTVAELNNIWSHAAFDYNDGSIYQATGNTATFTFDKPFPNFVIKSGDVLDGTGGSFNTVTTVTHNGSNSPTVPATGNATVWTVNSTNISGGSLAATKPTQYYTRTAVAYEDESTYIPGWKWDSGTSAYVADANSFLLEFNVSQSYVHVASPGHLAQDEYILNSTNGEMLKIMSVSGDTGSAHPSNGTAGTSNTGLTSVLSFTTSGVVPTTWPNMGSNNNPVRNKYTKSSITYSDSGTYAYSGSGNSFTLSFPAAALANGNLAFTDSHYVMDNAGSYSDVTSISNAIVGNENVFTVTLASPPKWADNTAWAADTNHYAAYTSYNYTDGSTYSYTSGDTFTITYPMQMSTLQFAVGNFVLAADGVTYHMIDTITGLNTTGTAPAPGWDASANAGDGLHTIEVKCVAVNQTTGVATGAASSNLAASLPAYYVGTVESSREVEWNPTMTYAANGPVFTMTFSSAPSSFPLAKGHYVPSSTTGRLALVKQVAKDVTGLIYTVTCDTDVQSTWPVGNGYYVKGYEAATTHYKMFVMDAAIIADNTLKQCIDQLSGTGLASALVDKDQIDFRYIVDTFGSYDTANGLNNKGVLSTLAKTRGNASALLNAPMVEEFKKSTNPSFLNPLLSNKFETRFIKDGGNLALNPTNLYALPSITDGANYAFYYGPGLNVKLSGVTKVIPPAAYISNNFIDKYTNALPWSIVAGPRRGVVGGSGVVGVEYAFDKDDRDILEPFGINPVVFVRGAGLTILGNKTAQQSIQSALSSAHVREVLIYIQDGIADILKDYVFEFNTVQTRLEIKTLCDGFMEGIKQDTGVYDYKNIMDTTNNTVDVIDANMGIVDTYVEPVKGLEIVVHRTTVLNTGEIQSGSF
jgi:hypothetical protein